MSFERVRSTPDPLQSEPITWLQPDSTIPDCHDREDEVMTRLRARAVCNGRSLDEEAKLILRDAVGSEPSSRNLASIIRSHFGPTEGVESELPSRD